MSSAITRLILGHLAAAGLVGCPSNQSPPPASSGEPPTVAVPTPSPEATAPEVPSPAPSAVAPAPTTGGGANEPLKEGQCRTNADCGDNRFCQRVFTGAEFTDDPGTCIDHPPVYKGRPLMVEGTARLAPLGPDGGWSGAGDDDRPHAMDLDWSTWLQRAAAEEHASVAAFARTICQLMALGAPATLIEGTQRAMADEIAHTRVCARWARRCGAGWFEPGALPEATASLEGTATELLGDVLRGGCIGETLAAHEMLERSHRAPGELGDALASIADDEATHAALAFRTARWLLDRDPSLSEVVDRVRRSFEMTASDADRAALSPLWPTLA